MRKLTVKISLNQEMRERIKPFMRYLESYRMLEIIRLDFEEGVKVVVVSFKLKDGFIFEEIEPPEFMDILSVLKVDGDEYTTLLKINVPDQYMGIMREYNTQFTSDMIWETPFYIDGKTAVMSCIGKEEELRRFLEVIESVGSIEEIKFSKATYDSKDLLSTLTEKQREVIQLAKKEGYYDYPRNITLEELSKELNISKSTAAEHLRKAEERLMGEILAAV